MASTSWRSGKSEAGLQRRCFPISLWAHEACSTSEANIVEVYDLSIVLGSGSRDNQTNQVVLVVAMGDRDVGLAVDGVSDIVDAEQGDFAEPPHKDGKVSAIVRQGEHLISIIDLNVLLKLIRANKAIAGTLPRVSAILVT